MLRNSFLTVALIAGGILALPATPASAFPAAQQTPTVTLETSNSPLLVQAQERRDDNRADNRRAGNRDGARSGGRCVEPNCRGSRAGDRSRDRAGRNRVDRDDNARGNRSNSNRVNRNNRAARDDGGNRNRVIRNDNSWRDNVRNRNNNFRNNNWAYNRSAHGPRCLSRGGNCRHYYRGYYYYSPFWILPYAGVSVIAGSNYRYRYNDNYDDGGHSSRHIEWCLDRYRSYDVSSNTWVSYSGEIRECRSPYY